MHHAETSLERPKQKYAWSPHLRNAGLLRRYWKLRERQLKHKEDHSTAIQRIEDHIRSHNQTFKLPYHNQPLALQTITKELNRASKILRKAQHQSLDLRYRSYVDLLAEYQNDTNPMTMKRSKQKKRNCVRAKQNTVQQDPRPEDFDSFLATTPTDDIIWDTVTDKATVEETLLKVNNSAFRAASESKRGHGVILDALTFSSLSPAGLDILGGKLPEHSPHDDNILKAFLSEFTVLLDIRSLLLPINNDIIEDDVTKGFRRWKEQTSTSPSGRHLGHNKSLIQHPTLLRCLTLFLHVATTKGIAISRWKNAVSIMIEKYAGSPTLNRLRIIHLFEADFNFFLKVQWGSHLVKRALNSHQLHDGQHGLVPSRSAIDPIMLTQLSNDACRILKHSLARFDNDASACYDRIIVPLGMMAARKCGMKDKSVRVHAEALQDMRYAVKTIHGISKGVYTGSKDSPLFGTGQGSGASPSVWHTLVVLLMKALNKLNTLRVTIHRSQPPNLDDLLISFTDSGHKSYTELATQLEKVGQTWETLLAHSGGTLNLEKCSFYIVQWEWLHGRPRISEMIQSKNSVHITPTNGHQRNPIPIRQTSTVDANRILGVYLSPSGNFSKHISIMKGKADTFAIRLRSPHLHHNDIQVFHKTIYRPSMKYSLPAIAVNEVAIQQVQTKVLSVILQRLGVSSKTPTAITHGPEEFGGLNLMDLQTESGIKLINCLRMQYTKTHKQDG